MFTKTLRLFFGLGFLFCATHGCGPRELPFTDNSKDSAAFALDIKTLALNTTAHIKSSKDPSAALGGLVSALSALDTSPAGTHLATLKEIHSLSSALMAEYEKGKPANLDAKVKAIADVASKLPGEVIIEKARNAD